MTMTFFLQESEALVLIHTMSTDTTNIPRCGVEAGAVPNIPQPGYHFEPLDQLGMVCSDITPSMTE